MTDTIVCDVETTMKYVVRGEKATFHAGDRGKSYWPVDEHTVTIHDVRPIADELAFDRNGWSTSRPTSPSSTIRTSSRATVARPRRWSSA
jgi:hypothetical protein